MQQYRTITLVLIVLCVALSQSQSCDNSFYTKEEFERRQLGYPGYLTEPQISSDLLSCQDFNGIASCCNAETIQGIESVFKSVKDKLQTDLKPFAKNILEFLKNFLRMKLPKDVSRQARNELKKQLIKIQVGIIKGIQSQIRCTNYLLKHFSGVLCQGCNAQPSELFQDGKIILKEDFFTELETTCYPVVEFYSSLQDLTQEGYQKVVDTLADFIGVENTEKVAESEEEVEEEEEEEEEEAIKPPGEIPPARFLQQQPPQQPTKQQGTRSPKVNEETQKKKLEEFQAKLKERYQNLRERVQKLREQSESLNQAQQTLKNRFEEVKKTQQQTQETQVAQQVGEQVVELIAIGDEVAQPQKTEQAIGDVPDIELTGSETLAQLEQKLKAWERKLSFIEQRTQVREEWLRGQEKKFREREEKVREVEQKIRNKDLEDLQKVGGESAATQTKLEEKLQDWEEKLKQFAANLKERIASIQERRTLLKQQKDELRQKLVDAGLLTKEEAEKEQVADPQDGEGEEITVPAEDNAPEALETSEQKQQRLRKVEEFLKTLEDKIRQVELRLREAERRVRQRFQELGKKLEESGVTPPPEKPFKTAKDLKKSSTNKKVDIPEKLVAAAEGILTQTIKTPCSTLEECQEWYKSFLNSVFIQFEPLIAPVKEFGTLTPVSEEGEKTEVGGTTRRLLADGSVVIESSPTGFNSVVYASKNSNLVASLEVNGIDENTQPEVYASTTFNEAIKQGEEDQKFSIKSSFQVVLSLVILFTIFA